LVRLALRPKQPPTATFKCARCSSISRHNKRTSEAWRRNAKQLFCDVCHRKWLASQPQQVQGSPPRGAPASSNRGCFGVMLLLALFPFALIAMILYA
jgi:hypothetical protein